MSVVVVATIRPAGGCRDQVMAALENAVARVHAEDDGCELYALHENDDRFVMLEKWASPEALAAHARGPAFVELANRLEGKLDAELDVQVLLPRPAGAAGRGLLLAGQSPAGPGRGTALVKSRCRAAHRAAPS
jgi:quinol monooxygenase YgiN